MLLLRQITPPECHKTHPGSPFTRQMTVRDALNSALDEELARDPSVYILGEEVG